MPVLLAGLKKSKHSSLIADIFTSLRPAQWLKNLVVFSAIIFSGDFFSGTKFAPVFYTFLIFCAASSAMYLINDLVDREADSLHFSKKKRPIAAGKISPKVATLTALVLAGLALLFSFQLSDYLFSILIVYLAIQLSYSLWFKNIIIIDTLAIAFSFMLRVFAGSFVVLTPLSSWLILTTMMLALLLAVGKRRSELTILSASQAPIKRRTLLLYPKAFLDGLVFMTATATLITYSLFTFNSPEIGGKQFFITYLPKTLSSPKLLMITVPLVVYGVFRYLYLIFEKSEGESPEKVLLSDPPLFTAVAIWLLAVFSSLYLFTS